MADAKEATDREARHGEKMIEVKSRFLDGRHLI
jgi:hypothetical protein